MIVVSNTSPIINLAAIRQLELLSLLHDLMTIAGFWIDQELYTRVLESAQEF